MVVARYGEERLGWASSRPGGAMGCGRVFAKEWTPFSDLLGLKSTMVKMVRFW